METFFFYRSYTRPDKVNSMIAHTNGDVLSINGSTSDSIQPSYETRFNTKIAYLLT